MFAPIMFVVFLGANTCVQCVGLVQTNTISVPTTTVDNIWNKHGEKKGFESIFMLKIDVEGFETARKLAVSLYSR